MQKARGEIPGPRFCSTAGGLVVHPAHASHTTARHSWSSAVLLRPFGHHGFRGDQKPGDRRSVLQGRRRNFGRVNDFLADEVHVFTVLGVEADAILILSRILPTTMEPSSPALITIWRAGQESALRAMSTPVFWSSFCVRTRFSASVARSKATPPPGRTPSSTAAGSHASRHRRGSLRSFTSTSLAPPTRITATPPQQRT